MTKKIDEAVSLNVTNTGEGGVTSNTTFTAEDTVALAIVLKNAGLAGNSNSFNGPASLTIDHTENGVTMNSTVNSPDLRSIMKLLEPELQAAGDLESGIEDMAQDAEVPAEEPCVDASCDMAEPEVDMGVDLDKPVIESDGSDGWYVEASYDYTEDYQDHQQAIEDEAGICDDSGAGDGVRDLGWYVASEEEARNLVSAIMALADTIPGLTATCWASNEMDESTTMVPYPGAADRRPVQPKTHYVPARSGDNPLSEGPFDNMKGKFPDTEQGAIDFMKFMSSHSMKGATATPDPVVHGVWLVKHKNGQSIVYLNDMDFEDIDESQKVTEAPYKSGGSDEFDTWIEDETVPAGEVEVTVYYDWDTGDFDTGLDHMPIASMGSSLEITAVVNKLTGEDLVDRLDKRVIASLEQQANDHGNRHQEESVAPKSFRDYVEEAAAKRKTPQFGRGVYYGIGYHGHHHDEDHGEDTSAELGFDMGGDFGESELSSDDALNELSGDLKGRYAAKALASKSHHEKKAGELDDLVYDAEHAERMGIMRKGAGDRVAKWRDAHDRTAWKREKGLDRLAPTAESLLDEFNQVDEAGRSSYQEKSRQFGKPYYLNTDCGYASLEDLGTHEYFHGDGVVVLAINRGGKWGLNFVAGRDNTPPGTKVTCVTQTTTGSKYREGKVVDSFTMDEYNNDRAGLEKRLAAHGITPTKKLSVKTFD